ncbi:sugar transferase [Alteraurantiacibacter aquimixticola]|uniref:Sugar transferase n=1 Tax=Alteraurantiacibacter aquimixticola TaxID=2489173 RepID=A0A4T3F6F1_9SPHN|nr:sugar transferase [Alteraurantiacibacter aquimixticola]
MFDFTLALTLAIVFAPLMLLLVLMVKLTSPGPVIFCQQRVGRNGELFPCLKLRTMVVDAQARLDHLLATDPKARAEWQEDQKLRNDPRITPIGHFLRRTSLDELPQLWNILMGHMSFVGPRPIVQDEVSRYGVHIGRYCAVRPGLTGLWQISGRNDVSYSERVRLDVKYVRRHTFVGDMFICARTVPAILGSRGCY